MTKEEFDSQAWTIGMKARTRVHSITRGSYEIEADIVEVNFSSRKVRVRRKSEKGEYFYYYKLYNEFELV